MTVDLLYEIGTEEIPAGVAHRAVLDLAEALRARLEEERLEPGEVRTAATPRRLTVHVSGLAERQSDRRVTFTGPKEAVGIDADGNPTKAALGFLRGKGAAPRDLEIIDSPKGRVCSVTKLEPGRTARAILSKVLPEVTGRLRFPKSMRWPGGDLAFTRPIRRVTVLLGSKAMPVTIAGILSGRTVAGHPFMAPGGIELTTASFTDYLGRLETEGKVLASVEARRALIEEGANSLTRELGGEGPVDADLLDEVTFLTEWPGVIAGSFDEEFLEVPREVLATAMKAHQRYFPVVDSDGRMRARFILVHNRGGRPAQDIRAGNERVLRARLSDARFFWDVDRKETLESRRESLEDMLFHRRLGTLREKTDRLAGLVTRLGDLVEDGEAVRFARRAALLCKSDLTTEMVGEFPELQGVMGRHYALADGEPEAVATAIEAHYFPRRQGEPVPGDRPAALLTLAEKLDNLVAFFSIGKEPRGSGDPFGLRRQAVGILRLLREGPLELPLVAVVARAAAVLPDAADGLADRVLAFLRDRLRPMLLDSGIRHDLIDAALAVGFSDLRDLDRRLAAIVELAGSAAWPELVTVVERTHNIAKKETGDLGAPGVDRLEEPEEKALFDAFQTHGAAVTGLFDEGDFVAAAHRFSEAFAAPVHAFFDKVFVNVDDEELRRNRMALCRAVNRVLTSRLADLSKVVIEGTKGTFPFVPPPADSTA